ncbi:helix-turn-helix domain-containing protein [Xenorhabdus bovienii]|uniref:HTH cro/C1-type domain-containing protein n=1 Tax=Xenorhabdus bovienii str. Intermedium TaxID=1379677 RepID=A0A077QBK5_XENBV|nr:transcriptional regulator [Xenorhabdus bovienii]MDE9455744.1 transcriptional regulator [Xenorhabdus bovienii]MDE9459311.1 transcriptional regulator [Xenorhabdus bovienii]MDE9460925.1 transcriptional regulator [Xenorhabdus bovienii]MDE9468338.1 transcriptional regulator [Xenorhabdus bovienii]MDE9483505.1 transcriptional regulator [Xenorhabdus bovienii]
MNTIGSRITEERERLGLSQAEFASLMGYPCHIQASHERDEIMPEGSYLQEITKHGCDILYVITGNKEQPINLSIDEQVLVDNYRAMNEAHRLKISSVSDTVTYKNINENVKIK